MLTVVEFHLYEVGRWKSERVRWLVFWYVYCGSVYGKWECKIEACRTPWIPDI